MMALGRNTSKDTLTRLAQAVTDLVLILSVGMKEIVRLVMHHCVERGVGVEKS